MKENYLSELTESTEKNLENVKILAHWKRENTNEVYSLAGLDRLSAQTKIQDQLNPLKAELSILFNSQKRSDLIRARKIYPKMYPLLTQWRIVSDKEFSYYPKEENFVQTALDKFSSPIEISSNWNGSSSLNETLQSYLKDLLLKSGYRFGKSIRRYTLKASVKEKELPIQIKGYLKKEFELNIDVYRQKKTCGKYSS